ncbi:MAG: lipopolysaccharide assembly protein LapA domain-containing protein [bacterium]
MLKIINFIILVIFVIFVLIFTIYNHTLVRVTFFNYESIKIPLSVIVFASIIIGMIIGLIYHFYVLFKIKKENKEDVIRNKNLGNS